MLFEHLFEPRGGRVRLPAARDRAPVAVRHTDGRWYPGRLHGPGGAGRLVVSYVVAPGVQHYACVPAARVRPLEPPGVS